MKKRGNILVVDDDPDMLNMLELVLTRDGHQVTKALNWKEVVSGLNKLAVNEQSYDLIFLDLMMPERSGFDILRSLKVILFPMPPVVVLTALDGIEHAVNALELGASKYLTKPVRNEKLLGTVQEVLQGKQLSRF